MELADKIGIVIMAVGVIVDTAEAMFPGAISSMTATKRKVVFAVGTGLIVIGLAVVFLVPSGEEKPTQVVVQQPPTKPPSTPAMFQSGGSMSLKSSDIQDPGWTGPIAKAGKDLEVFDLNVNVPDVLPPPTGEYSHLSDKALAEVTAQFCDKLKNTLGKKFKEMLASRDPHNNLDGYIYDHYTSDFSVKARSLASELVARIGVVSPAFRKRYWQFGSGEHVVISGRAVGIDPPAVAAGYLTTMARILIWQDQNFLMRHGGE